MIGVCNKPREAVQGAMPPASKDDANFARWQPEYAKHGVPVFPVWIDPQEKRPLVRNFMRTTPRSSAKFAMEFASAKSFGFPCGKPSGLTVVDMDSTDESILLEGERLFGASPLVWRTGSGKYAMAFRHNGEPRKIRPIKTVPIDLLGAGGYAVAPPSAGTLRDYEIIRGTLADLDHLPVARMPDELQRQQHRHAPGNVMEGERHKELKKYLMGQVWHCDDFNALLDCAMTFGQTICDTPMPDDEIIRLADWFWKSKEKGVLHRSGHRHWTDDAHDLVAEGDRDASSLLLFLRVEHPGQGQQFVVANALASKLGMDRERFSAKRNLLVKRGHLRLIKRHTCNVPALYGWPL